jgi:hypothetical protein
VGAVNERVQKRMSVTSTNCSEANGATTAVKRIDKFTCFAMLQLMHSRDRQRHPETLNELGL